MRLFIKDDNFGYIAFGAEWRIDNDFTWSIRLNHRGFAYINASINDAGMTEFVNNNLRFCNNCDGTKCTGYCTGKLRFDDPTAEMLGNIQKLINIFLVNHPSNKPATKEPVIEKTIIGSRKLTSGQLNKFFKQTLGDDYKNHPLVCDVIALMSRYWGKTLKEIVDKSLANPPKIYTGTGVTTLAYQKKFKPKIEDVLPEMLPPDMLNPVMDFVAYLRKSKISPAWGGIHNDWTNSYKGKLLYKISLDRKGSKWLVYLFFDNFKKYEEQLKGTELEKFIWDNLSYCSCKGGRCDIFFMRRRNKTIFGKTIDNFGCMPLIRATELNADGIEQFKKLLEMEKQARTQ